MSAGLTLLQLQKTMQLGATTIDKDIARMKAQYPGEFMKARSHRIPVYVLEQYYGFERNEILAIMETERADRLALIKNQGLTAAEIALAMQRPYASILPLVQRIKAHNPDKCEATSFRVPVELIRVNLCSNILELVAQAITRANSREGLEAVMYHCATCAGNSRLCHEHKPYQAFLTPENLIRVSDSWKHGKRAIQVPLFPEETLSQLQNTI